MEPRLWNHFLVLYISFSYLKKTEWNLTGGYVSKCFKGKSYQFALHVLKVVGFTRERLKRRLGETDANKAKLSWHLSCFHKLTPENVWRIRSRLCLEFPFYKCSTQRELCSTFVSDMFSPTVLVEGWCLGRMCRRRTHDSLWFLLISIPHAFGCIHNIN